MAIVDLGTQTLTTGLNPVPYTPFAYDENLAYSIGVILTSSNFNQIFSYIRVRTLLQVPGFPAYSPIWCEEIEIIPVNQLFFFPASPLFFGSGTCQFFAERLPRWRGAGDATVCTMQLLYDDALTVPSWRA